MINLNLKATGIELTDAIRSYAEKKFGSLEKYLGENARSFVVRAEVGKTTEHHKEGPYFRAEVHVAGPGLEAYAQAEAEDLYAAIDLCEAEVIRELKSRKGKRETLMRRGGRVFKDMVRGFGNRFKKQ